MNKEELQNKISELEETLWHLQEELEDMEEKEAEKGKIWKPKENEKFYAITRLGKVVEIDDQYLLDLYTSIGNCYPTKEKAEFEANREKYTRLFRQYVEQHSEPLDWDDEEQNKCFCAYDYNCGNIEYRYNCTAKAAFAIYASSKEVLQEAIDFIGKKNFLEFVMEVKEN